MSWNVMYFPVCNKTYWLIWSGSVYIAHLTFICRLTFADLIPARDRSPWLPFFMLLGSVRALERAGVVSNRSALCPSISVGSCLDVSSLPPSSLLLALQHSCILFSLHGHSTKGVSGWHIWWLAWPLHRSRTFHFWFGLSFLCPESILACSSRF